MWTAKSSISGFSVSLFWPSGVVIKRMKPKKLRRELRRRKQPKANKTNTVTDETAPPVSADELSGNGNARHPDVQVSLNKAQTMPTTIPSLKLQLLHLFCHLKLLMKHLQVLVSVAIDLLSCANALYYEKRSEVLFMESPISVTQPTGVDGLQ